FERPAQPFWEQWFNFLHSRGLHCWNEDAARTTPWLLNEKLKSKFPALLASKYHEICNEIAHKAATYRNLKHANTEFQKLITERHEKLAIPDCPFWMSSGTAKILLVAAHPKIDMPIAEPTAHDHCFLYSTLRKTAPLHNKPWGSHIPIQWYMGTEHSEDKIRRFSLSLHLAHMMGAKLIYSESGLFKFVQYKRLDYDHPISRQARDAIRSFYIHTQLHPIPKPAKPLANINLLYGNLDSFFFFHDHTPIDTGKSNNRQLWYKWPFTHEDHAWQAARTLFPPTNNNELKGYPTDTHEPRFSSNPFGSVDIIPIADLLKNTLPLTILLGRNIMTPQILRSLTTYVKNGGTLFLSLHHFNTNPNPTTAPKYNPTQIAQLLGHQLRFTTTPKIHTHHLGKGTVHCYTGSRPMGHPTVRPFIDDCLRQLATQHRPAIHLTNNQPVYIQQYDLGNQVTQLNLLNLNWKHPHLPTCANLSLNGTTYPLPIPFGPPTFLVATPTFAIIPHSSTTQIYNFEGHDSAYSFSATGSGFETFTILQSPNHAITDLLIDGLPAPFYPTAQNENILKFSVPLTRQRAITIHHT
ncbi:MAG: hypothetical protein FWD53_12555, partial [Phycisphaerales bacterium]|nr:hypothetical protein [Phycisphaerales bacterium]